MRKENKLEYILNLILKIFWIFIIGSIIGYIIEMIVAFVQNNCQIVSRQGLVYGPFIPVYGIGIVVYDLIVPNIKNRNNIKVFSITMILGGIVEYIFSYFQEKCFGTISWNYSNLPFNINGRTSLLHCIYWGTGGILFINLIYPIIEKYSQYLKNAKVRFITYMLIIFMIFNIIVSCLAAQRQKERFNYIQANSKFDVLLDKYFSNERMSKIYSNRIIIME